MLIGAVSVNHDAIHGGFLCGSAFGDGFVCAAHKVGFPFPVLSSTLGLELWPRSMEGFLSGFMIIDLKVGLSAGGRRGSGNPFPKLNPLLASVA